MRAFRNYSRKEKIIFYPLRSKAGEYPFGECVLLRARLPFAGYQVAQSKDPPRIKEIYRACTFDEDAMGLWPVFSPVSTALMGPADRRNSTSCSLSVASAGPPKGAKVSSVFSCAEQDQYH
jgi:hypothetical protein